jgi:putative two-component system response regulator
MTTTDNRPKLLLVDDEPLNLQVLRQILQEAYRLFFAKDGLRAIELAEREQPDLILMDVMMPGLTGHDACLRLKQNCATASIPVIFVTALNDVDDEAKGFEVGAVDYITKPVSAPVVRARVKTHLSLVRADELRESRLQIVQCLGLAAEYKDNETGLHVIRMSHYSRILALAAGFSAADADDILHAAPMHDIGKIGIPDRVLQKQGKLDDQEWAIMRQHVQIGADIIGEHERGLLRIARIVALTHHERWDGTGYPNGLKGEEIPIEGRIVAVADVFDALTSVRPYKTAWSESDAIDLLIRERNKHFDPRLIDLFIEQLPEIRKIRERWPDVEESTAAKQQDAVAQR